MATRRANDGNFYTMQEFQRFYGDAKGLNMWENAGAQEPGAALRSRGASAEIEWSVWNFEFRGSRHSYRAVMHRGEGGVPDWNGRSSSPQWPRPDTHVASKSVSRYKARQGPRCCPAAETNNASGSERQLQLWPRWRDPLNLKPPSRAWPPFKNPLWDLPPAFYFQTMD